MEQTLVLASHTAMEDFFDNAIRCVDVGAWHSSRYRIGSNIVRLKVSGARLRSFMTEALMHITADQDKMQGQDLVVYAIDEQELQVAIPDAPWAWHTGDREGYIHGIDVNRFTVNLDHATQSLRFLDRQRNVALHWMRDMSLVPYWERSFPLREILNWWYRDTAMQPLHAAAVGIDKMGALISARGGSGKSSTALTCLFSGMQLAGDDFVLVNADSARAYSLYNIVKLEPHTLERFPSLTPPPGTPMIDQNKYQISLARYKPEGLQRVFDLKVILIPQITHEPKTYLSPIDKSEVSSALMLSTFYLLKGDTRAAFVKIKRLVDALPAYRLNLGLDFDQIPEVIKNAIQGE